MRKAVVLLLAIMFSTSVCAAEINKEAVTMVTSDGVTISGFFVKGSMEKGPAVLLLHMLNRSKEDWEPIVEKYLAPDTPFSYLAIDLRGHGASVTQADKTINWKDFTEQQFNDMVKDVAAAVKWLKARAEVDPEKIAIVGASIGANLALNYAADDTAIKCVGLLSPGLNYRGVKTDQSISKYGTRPILIAGSREDAPSGMDIEKLDGYARGAKTFRRFDGNLHGTKLFGSQPVDKLLADFLMANLK